MLFFSPLIFATCAWLAVSDRSLDVGMDADEAFNESTKRMLTYFGTCVEPENPGIFQSQEDINNFMDRVCHEGVCASRGLADGWSNWAFADFWVGRKMLPSHLILGLYHDSDKYRPGQAVTDKDAECFKFDYDDPAVPDHAGCRPFKKSFKELAALRNQLRDVVAQDEVWKNRYARRLRTTGEGGEGEGFAYDQWCTQSVWKPDTKLGMLPVALCETNFVTESRVQEMMKFILHPPAYQKYVNGQLGGADPSAEQLFEYVKRKALTTTSWPKSDTWREEETDDEFKQGLQTRTLEEVAKLFRAHPGNFELAWFKWLMKVSPCQAIMYDKTEINGFGFQDASVKFLTDKYFTTAGLKEETVYPVPAFCGRLAFSLATPMQYASYDMFPTLSSAITFNTRIPWVDCQNSGITVNCRSAYYCFEAGLRRACGLTPTCCPQRNMALHGLCKDWPDGRVPEVARLATITPATLVNSGCSAGLYTDRFRPTAEQDAFAAFQGPGTNDAAATGSAASPDPVAKASISPHGGKQGTASQASTK